ncbi:hypothetical protein J6590_016461 [Homalodisca vitripennis]|nr:hypothetical protein J6590_016461 [Homalodisca vitripennis]
MSLWSRLPRPDVRSCTAVRLGTLSAPYHSRSGPLWIPRTPYHEWVTISRTQSHSNPSSSFVAPTSTILGQITRNSSVMSPQILYKSLPQPTTVTQSPFLVICRIVLGQITRKSSVMCPQILYKSLSQPTTVTQSPFLVICRIVLGQITRNSSVMCPQILYKSLSQPTTVTQSPFLVICRIVLGQITRNSSVMCPQILYKSLSQPTTVTVVFVHHPSSSFVAPFWDRPLGIVLSCISHYLNQPQSHNHPSSSFVARSGTDTRNSSVMCPQILYKSLSQPTTVTQSPFLVICRTVLGQITRNSSVMCPQILYKSLSQPTTVTQSPFLVICRTTVYYPGTDHSE